MVRGERGDYFKSMLCMRERERHSAQKQLRAGNAFGPARELLLGSSVQEQVPWRALRGSDRSETQRDESQDTC